MKRLDGKVVLITGGESGIGLEAARLSIAEGAAVHILGLDRSKLAEADRLLGPADCLTSEVDVTDESVVRSAIAEGVARFGQYDCLFSNAGISGDMDEIAVHSSKSFLRTLEVHISGAFHIIKHGAPSLRDGGSIIVMSSVAGLMGFPRECAYVAAKHGQVGLMRTAALELAPRGIRVNTLHPGPTSTPFQDQIEMAITGKAKEEAAATFDAMTPLRRHASPREIAEAVLYLASDASAMVTASTFTIDGGIRG